MFDNLLAVRGKYYEDGDDHVKLTSCISINSQTAHNSSAVLQHGAQFNLEPQHIVVKKLAFTYFYRIKSN